MDQAPAESPKQKEKDFERERGLTDRGGEAGGIEDEAGESAGGG